MLHLLPQYQKRKVINEYRMRLVVIIAFSLLAIVVVFIVFTLPSYIFLLTQKQVLSSQKAGYESIISVGTDSMGEGGVDVAKAVLALKPYPNPLSPTLFISAINKAAGNVQVDAYAFTQDQVGGSVTAVIDGVAKSREGLSSLVESLNTVFGGVKLPLASFARQSDIPFEFRFMMEYPKVLLYTGTATTSSVKTQ
jgi:hypothetical protein